MHKLTGKGEIIRRRGMFVGRSFRVKSCAASLRTLFKDYILLSWPLSSLDFLYSSNQRKIILYFSRE